MERNLLTAMPTVVKGVNKGMESQIQGSLLSRVSRPLGHSGRLS